MVKQQGVQIDSTVGHRVKWTVKYCKYNVGFCDCLLS